MLEAIILAGGIGSRLKGVVPNLPKPMAPIKDKPFLQILLESLEKKGFSRIVISVGYMAEKISNYFGDSFNGIEIVYSNESKRLGTGGAIKLAMKKISQDHVYILNGDSFIDFNVCGIEKIWKKHKEPIIVTSYIKNVSRYGAVSHKDGILQSFNEKGLNEPGYINAGCYILGANFHKQFTEDIFSFEHWLDSKKNKIKFRVYFEKSRFIDIGIPEDYQKAQKFEFH